MTAPRHATRPPTQRRRTLRAESARRATRRPQRPAGPATATDWPVRAVQAALFLGVVAVLSLAPARAASGDLGLVPVWLVVLPASAWLALAVARRRTAAH